MELEIIEEYKNYEPPFDVRWYVEKLLDSVDEKYKKKLRYVVLTNHKALDRLTSRQKFSATNQIYNTDEKKGAYSTFHDDTGGIELFMDIIVLPETEFVLRFHFVRAYVIGYVLFHLLGHHVHEKFKSLHDDEEISASQWQRLFWNNYVKKNHFLWRILFLYPFVYIKKALNLIRKR